MANEVIKGCRTHHTGLMVPDWEAAIHFYTEGLGFKLKYRWTHGCMLEVGDGTYLEIFPNGEYGTNANGYVHLCLHVDDVQAAIDRAVAYGAKQTGPITEEQLECSVGGTWGLQWIHLTGLFGETIEFLKEMP